MNPLVGNNFKINQKETNITGTKVRTYPIIISTRLE